MLLRFSLAVLSPNARKQHIPPTLSKFLGGDKAGWPESKIEAILSTLATIERSRKRAAQRSRRGSSRHGQSAESRTSKSPNKIWAPNFTARRARR